MISFTDMSQYNSCQKTPDYLDLCLTHMFYTYNHKARDIAAMTDNLITLNTIIFLTITRQIIRHANGVQSELQIYNIV